MLDIVMALANILCDSVLFASVFEASTAISSVPCSATCRNGQNFQLESIDLTRSILDAFGGSAWQSIFWQPNQYHLKPAL